MGIFKKFIESMDLNPDEEECEDNEIAEEGFDNFKCPKCNRKFKVPCSNDSVVSSAIGVISAITLGAGWISTRDIRCPDCNKWLKKIK